MVFTVAKTVILPFLFQDLFQKSHIKESTYMILKKSSPNKMIMSHIYKKL